MREPPSPPPWLNLGNLNSVQVGDTVVCIQINEKTRSITHAKIRIIRKVEDWRILTNTEEGKPIGGWVRKNNGACLPMYGVPYYFSANPEHIMLARIFKERDIKEVSKRKEQEKAEKEEKDRRKLLAKEAGEALGDGSHEDDDGNIVYSDSIAEALVDRLTDEQIKTLTFWLKSHNPKA